MMQQNHHSQGHSLIYKNAFEIVVNFSSMVSIKKHIPKNESLHSFIEYHWIELCCKYKLKVFDSRIV